MVIKKIVRTKYRYIKFVYIGKPQTDIENWIRESVVMFLGLFNMPYLKLISYEPNTGTGIIKCNRNEFENVRTALIFMYNNEYKIKLLKSSGTLKSLV